MGNLRDGGVIVIGASERGDSWDLSGILPEHLATYDVDVAVDIMNSYCSPYIEVSLVTVEYRNGRKFLAIEVHEFNDTPLVCKKNGPEGLVEGTVYLRPPGMAKTTKITNATQMHDLLELAAEKRARRILESSRHIGLVPSETSTEQFDNELRGL